MSRKRACFASHRIFKRRLRLLTVVVGVGLLALAVAGSEVYEDYVEPVRRVDGPEFTPWYSPDVDGSISAPHPPIDQIPPIPIPSPQVQPTSGRGAPVLHNAVTDETITLEPSTAALSGLSAYGGGWPGLGGGGDEAVRATFNTMTQIGGVNLENHPWRMNCKLVMRWGDNYYVGSGTMRDAGTVLTAGHCVYSHDEGGWADEVWVYPGWDGTAGGSAGAWGRAHGTYLGSWTTWTVDENYDGDVGLVCLDDRSVGMLTGWFGWSYGGDCPTQTGRTYHNASYPAEGCGTVGLHTGTDMYYWYGNFDACPNNQLQLNTSGGCFDAVWGGMSGSGAYWIDGDNRYVHAICSTSNRSTRGYYCRQWEDWVLWSENTFIPNCRGTTFDLEALQFRSSGTTTVAAGGSLPDCTVRICNATNANPGSATYTLRCYLSTNTDISSFDTLLGTWNYTVDFTSMHNSGWIVPSPDIPANTPAGTYWVGVVLDSGTDSNSANNDTDTWDAQQISVTCLPTSAPSSITASDGTFHQYVYVDWPAVSGASEYRVYRDNSDLSGWITQTEYYDTTATPGPVYMYKAQARKACGSGSESAFSPANPGWRRVAPPTGVSATNGTYADKVRVTWNSVWGAGGYRVYRSDTIGGAKTAVSGWIAGLSYDDTTGDPFLAYYYWVRSAEDLAGSYPSDYSSSDTGWRDTSTAATFRVDATGRMFADGITRAAHFVVGSADVAEWIAVSEPVEPGDVVELDPKTPGSYRLTSSACSGLVAGVISTEPGVILGLHGYEGLRALLALSGIVPVKVTGEGGPIQIGDLLVSASTAGCAMRWAGTAPCPCPFVGKALEPMYDERGTILVLLTAH